MGAVAARGTVEMLSAPERVKVSTDVPSQPLSSTVYHCRAQILAVSLGRPGTVFPPPARARGGNVVLGRESAARRFSLFLLFFP
jgi:hypothetical protein